MQHLKEFSTKVMASLMMLTTVVAVMMMRMVLDKNGEEGVGFGM